MGTWGPGTWENDTALDFAGNTVAGLRRLIRRELDAAEHDGGLERSTLAMVALLRCILAELNRPSFLTAAEVEGWRDRYLAWFDWTAAAAFRDLADAPVHRSHAVNEFAALLRWARGAEGPRQ